MIYEIYVGENNLNMDSKNKLRAYLKRSQIKSKLGDEAGAKEDYMDYLYLKDKLSR